MDYSLLATVIEKAVEEKVAARAAHIRLGTVTAVSGAHLSAVIDGGSAPTQMVRACSCATGNRIVVMRQGTQLYAIAKVGG